MIKFFNDLETFKKQISQLNLELNIDAVFNLDFAFFERHDKYTLISIPDYDVESENILLIHKNNCYIYTIKNFNNFQKRFKKILSKKFGESTVMILLLFKVILKNYSQEFLKIRSQMNALDLNPFLDKIEESGRSLRHLTDRIEELVNLIITLKETEVKEFDTSLITFDYDMLNAEARYWLERCRSHIYRVASLRTKSEMLSNRELNVTMKRLTVIMTFLSIIGIVVSVPGTIGAIFGIPALSDAYFKQHTLGLVFALIFATILTVILGYIYWRSLKLK
ncbi:MAG: CorA family divalent cation transporter [Nanoarchaeota archaeon]